MAALPELRSERLRMQLSTVGERFAGFKSSIADDSRKRKQIDEQRYQASSPPPRAASLRPGPKKNAMYVYTIFPFMADAVPASL